MSDSPAGQQPQAIPSATRVDAVDVGLSHVALVVRCVEASQDFYQRFAGMEIVHRREGSRGPVVWLSDLSRPFVIVLMQAEERVGGLGGFSHLGVGCRSRAEVDRLCELAEAEGCLKLPAEDRGAPVGYRALLLDPDGNNLELAYGQHVHGTIRAARGDAPPRAGGDFAANLPS